MKIVDKRTHVKHKSYSELETYKFYEYYTDTNDSDGLFMKLAGGVLEMTNLVFVGESSVSMWGGRFVDVECELHLMK